MSYVIIYTIENKASKRGKDLLVDKRGFKYYKGKVTGVSTRWRCTKTTKGAHCKAYVVQFLNLFSCDQIGKFFLFFFYLLTFQEQDAVTFI